VTARLVVAVACTLAVTTFALVRSRGADPVAAGRVRPDRVLLGAYVSPDGHRWDRAGVSALERRIGRPLAIDHRFKHWTDPFPSAADDWDHAHGRIPMITWEPDGTTLAAIASGADDGVVRERATAVARDGRPLLLRFAHEMNADWYRWDGARASTPGTHDGPARYVAAWRHVHAVFVAAGATNVQWVWSPNHRSIPAASWNAAARYYPGDDVVDWVGIDGYDRDAARPVSFASLFGPLATEFAGRKPVMVAETATDGADPGRAARWIDAARRAIDAGAPPVRAVVWFDTVKRGHDWRVDRAESVTGAFRSLARDPRMGQASS
jgi:hypothetical protein